MFSFFFLVKNRQTDRQTGRQTNRATTMVKQGKEREKEKKKESCKGTPTLNIVGFDDREQTHADGIVLPDWLPKHEFFMLIVAPAGCGKTTLILNILLRIYKNYFNKILVFSPTIHNDQKWHHLTKTKGVLRPNPHASVWEGKVKLKTLSSDHVQNNSKQHDDQDEFVKMISSLTPETFPALFGSTKARKGRRLASQQVKKNQSQELLALWKQLQLEKQQDGRGRQSSQLPTTEAILAKYKRVRELSNIINPPLDPSLKQYVRDFNQMLGLEDTLSSSSSSSLLGGSLRERETGQDGRATIARGPGWNYMPFGISRNGDLLRLSGDPRIRRQPQRSIFPQHHQQGKTAGWFMDNVHRYSSTGFTGSSVFPYFLTRRLPPLPFPSEDTTHETCDQQQGLNPSDNPADQQDQNRRIGKMNRHLTQVQHDCLFEEYSEETLQTIMDNQDKIVRYLTDHGKEMTDADHMCMVFDDMVGSGLFNAKRNNAFKRLTVRRRHFCSSVIGVVQAYKEFPKTSRNNTNIFIFFKIDSDEELIAIYRDFPCGLTWPVWRKAYEYCTREPYSFMMVNLQVKDPRYRIVKNFDEPLNVPVYERELQEQWAASLGKTTQIGMTLPKLKSQDSKKNHDDDDDDDDKDN